MMADKDTLTHEIPRRIWSEYFDGLSRMYQGWRCDVELLSMDMGDQPLAQNDRLWGLSFEREGTAANSILIETGDPIEGIDEHWAFDPVSVREANTQPGYEADIQIECSDGSIALLRIQRRPELTAGRDTGREARGRTGQTQEQRGGAGWQQQPSNEPSRTAGARPEWFGSGRRSRTERVTDQVKRETSQKGRAKPRVPRAKASGAHTSSELHKGGSLLVMLGAEIAALWLFTRMLGGRRKASSREARAYERSWPEQSWPTRSSTARWR